MAAVGLSDVFKYGATFLGYLVAVVVAAGVVVGGGAYLASTGGVSLGTPSLDSLTNYRAIAGMGIVAVGGLIALSGLFGLVHKLAADAGSAAVVAAARSDTELVAGSPSSAVDDGSSEADDESETTDASGADDPAESDESPVADEGAAAPGDGEGVAAANQPVVNDHGDEQDVPGEPTVPETDEPGPSRTRTDATPATEAGTDGDESPSFAEEPPETTDPSSSGSVPTDATPNREPGPDATGISAAEEIGVDDGASETTTDEEEDWTGSEYATGAHQEEREDGEDTHADRASTGSETSTGSGDARADDDAGPKEWTPPDPAEFDQPEETADDVGTEDETAPVEAGTDWDGEPATQPTEADRTWDDVRSSASSAGIDAEPASDVGDESPDRDGMQSAEPADVGEAESDAEEDDDATLADEGVSSFEVEADDDPLGDRLAGDDG